ncbi:MAG: HEAT repeat domain-containing protein [Armatimonadota bacterium]
MHFRTSLKPSAPVLVWTGIAATCATVALAAAPRKAAPKPKPPIRTTAQPSARPAANPNRVLVSRAWEKTYNLKAGEAREISVHLEQPSALPPNGRLAAEWTLVTPANPADVVATPENGPRKVDAEGIYTRPTADWRKVLHALDGDLYMVYRAPVTGTYRLRLVPVVDEAPVGAGPRWREKGTAPDLFPAPSRTPWPQGTSAPVSVELRPIDLGTDAQHQKHSGLLEAEPNDTPEQAQYLALVPNDDVRTYEITGTSDDVEYFDNGKVGRSGDDWFRVEVKGSEPRLVTAQLSIPGQFLAARLRCYELGDGASPAVPLGALLPVKEFFGKVNPQRLPWQENKQIEWPEGRDPNERPHQQEEEFRSSITRILQPGKSYYFRVEANAPSYALQLRVLRPAPYRDPRMAVRQGMYLQIGQVDAWLSSRPRGASVDRRIRDTGNLLGTQCMSCHTHSGIWGPAVPIQNGYPVEQPQNFWHLQQLMYECLRPTNELKDAAVNTSLAPLDIGDGPAGTRAAGFNIVNTEKIQAPKKLHSKQQLRTANYMLQTNDPGGINAAGPGSNYGQNIVWLFSGEILNESWKRTGDPKFFRGVEDKARKLLAYQPRFTDDVGVRLDFFGRAFPIDRYPAEAAKAAAAEQAAGAKVNGTPAEVTAFVQKVKEQIARDVARLRAIQNDDGSWGYSPGTTNDGGATWKRAENDWDPSPTSMALIGLVSSGLGKDDPTVKKAVDALLRMQDPNGRWNRAAITGFVTSAYALRALGPLYPVQPRVPQRSDFTPKPEETLLATMRRVQALAMTGDRKLADLMVQAAKHPNTLVRYWGMIGLGAAPTDAGVPVLVAALNEPAKPVRDAAIWALKQNLLDDRGWEAAFTAYEKGGDYTREGVLQALGMRADAVLPESKVSWNRLSRLLDRAMNEDKHPAVRAYASKAAWQWWIWNPPIRAAVNQSWLRMLERPEPNALVENNNRYASHALFIANGHKANASSEHQYKELATLFEAIRGRLEKADAATKSRVARRLVAVAGTFYQTAGGDGGPGQLGYSTPGAGAAIGQAVVVYLREVLPAEQKSAILAGLEGAANVPHGPLQEFLVDYTLKAPEELRQAAAAALSDPRSAMLQAATERVEPLIEQVKRGAAEPARRASLSDPVLELFGTVNWVIPDDREQQRHFFNLMIPKFDRYVSAEELKAMADAGKRGELEREMQAQWYLADRLGGVLASNPDLHKEIVFEQYVPKEFRNDLERHFWVRSVPWILEHKLDLPQMPANPDPNAPQQVHPGLIVKDQALQLYLDALKPDAPKETRAAAVRISNQTAVRKNPEVLLALSKLLEVEKDERLTKIAGNVLKQGSEQFVPDVVKALQAEKRPGKWLTEDGKVSPGFLKDLTFFRDYVMPELARVKRSDQVACLGCHGIQARVPSFYLKPVDEFGYISVPDLLYNYREMQARVNLMDLEKSKILRKPLNVQDGTEDGHQGGRRYLPQDEGYLLLKQWVDNQPAVLKEVMAASAAPSLRSRRVASRPLRNPALKPREPLALSEAPAEETDE